MKSRDERNEDGSDQERKYFHLYVFFYLNKFHMNFKNL